MNAQAQISQSQLKNAVAVAIILDIFLNAYKAGYSYGAITALPYLALQLFIYLIVLYPLSAALKKIANFELCYKETRFIGATIKLAVATVMFISAVGTINTVISYYNGALAAKTANWQAIMLLLFVGVYCAYLGIEAVVRSAGVVKFLVVTIALIVLVSAVKQNGLSYISLSYTPFSLHKLDTKLVFSFLPYLSYFLLQTNLKPADATKNNVQNAAKQKAKNNGSLLYKTSLTAVAAQLMFLVFLQVNYGEANILAGTKLFFTNANFVVIVLMLLAALIKIPLCCYCILAVANTVIPNLNNAFKQFLSTKMCAALLFICLFSSASLFNFSLENMVFQLACGALLFIAPLLLLTFNAKNNIKK